MSAKREKTPDNAELEDNSGEFAPPKTRRIASETLALQSERSSRKVAASVVALASNFANRTGGMTADLWANLPEALRKISAQNAVRLTEKAREFLGVRSFRRCVIRHFPFGEKQRPHRADAMELRFNF